MNQFADEEQNKLVTDELLVFLQEKRTALAMIRIGIATVLAQLGILSFLIATSKYYAWMEVLHLLIPFTVMNLLLLAVATYFIFKSFIHIHRLDRQILRYKKRHSVLADFTNGPVIPTFQRCRSLRMSRSASRGMGGSSYPPMVSGVRLLST